MRPWEYEQLQPVDVLEVEEAERRRRNGDLKVIGASIAWIVSMLSRTSPDQITRTLPGYDIRLEVKDRMSAIERQPDQELATDGPR